VAPEAVRKKRRPQRRGQILAAAVALFHERGYHATGMDEIGAAAGITGPGVYRHFRSKEEILETLIHERGASVVDQVDLITSSEMAPFDALDALARSYVEGIVDQPSLAVVAMYERHTLSAETRSWIDRNERRNLEAWVEVVRLVRADLSEAEARVLVHAALTLGVSVCNYKSGLDDETLVGLLHPMVMQAVLGPTPAPTPRKRARGSASTRG
jgi:AcrR family transcriptional regulator